MIWVESTLIKDETNLCKDFQASFDDDMNRHSKMVHLRNLFQKSRHSSFSQVLIIFLCLQRDWVQQALTCQPAPSPATHGWPDEATDKPQKPCRENVAISPSNARLIISLHYLAPFGRMDRRGVQVRPSTAPRSLLKNPPPRVSERGGG